MKKGIISQRVSAISPSQSLAITGMAKALVAQGHKVCSFAAGEPDFDTPDHIKEAAIDALRAGKTKYTPAAGLPELKEAIAAKLRDENGLVCKADQVVISNGAKQSLFNVFMALLRDGDEVVIPAPYWLSYPEMVLVPGGKPVFVETTEAAGFKMTPAQLDAAITPRTKAVILNSPSNPTGAVYTRGELLALAEVIVARGVYVVSDEIYEKIVYEGAEHVSIGSLHPDITEWTITVNGFSKAYSMTGWRLGYVAAPEFLVKAMNALQSHSTSGPNTFAQYGALAALRGPADAVGQMVNAFAERRAYLAGRLESVKGISCARPMGAFYAFPSIARFGIDDITFTKRLLEECKVAVIPGSPFGAPENIRLSYACSMAEIEEGLNRIETFVGGL